MLNNCQRAGLRCAALVAALSAGGLCHGEAVKALTRPSKDVDLSFVRAGRVMEILVKEGDAVRAGQELIRLDDEAEQAKLEYLKAKAEDAVRIRAAEAELRQKKLYLVLIEWAAAREAVTKNEVEQSRLEVVVSKLRLALANFEHAQDRREYSEAMIHVSRMCLKSPISGTVEEVDVEAGESVDALAKVMRVVKTDPFWIDASVPITQARRLKCGAAAHVEFPGPKAATATGKVIHVASVAQAGHKTRLRVRIEIANPAGRPAGENVQVRFEPSAKADGGGKAEGVAPVRKVASKDEALPSRDGSQAERSTEQE